MRSTHANSTIGGSTVKKVLFLAMVAVMVFAFATTAFADPTVLPAAPAITPDTHETPGVPTVIAPDGGSRWSYQDAADLSPKREGGYLPFNAGSIYASAGAAYDSNPLVGYDQAQFAGKGPHGGYDTSTNKCKACHAVHRAEGTYYLLRADTQDDACNYCHIGAGAKSADIVYSGNPAGIDTPNGHTMGASSRIPGSTVRMDNVTMVVNGANVLVRTYQDARKQLFRTVAWGRSPASHPYTGGAISQAATVTWGVVGPTPLSCSNCHQVHNALTQIWQPPAQTGLTGPTGTLDRSMVTAEQLTTGYKLLRRFPGATRWNTAGPATGFGPFGPTVLAKVPESTLTMGVNYSALRSGETTYTDTTADGGTWRQPDWILGADMQNLVNDTGAWRSARNEALVSQFAMSVWCADCHNLNIGAPGSLVNTPTPEVGVQKLHGDRTHPVPASRTMQCYSCHRSGLGTGGTGCARCHYSPAEYRGDAAAALDFLGRPTDFPHAGADDEYKLLGAFSVSTLPPAETGNFAWTLSYRLTDISENNLDAVCIRCHTDQGIHQ